MLIMNTILLKLTVNRRATERMPGLAASAQSWRFVYDLVVKGPVSGIVLNAAIDKELMFGICNYCIMASQWLELAFLEFPKTFAHNTG